MKMLNDNELRFFTCTPLSAAEDRGVLNHGHSVLPEKIMANGNSVLRVGILFCDSEDGDKESDDLLSPMARRDGPGGCVLPVI